MKKIITIVQCILFLVSPYIARELCLMSKNLVDNMFLTFFIMLTISFLAWYLEVGRSCGKSKIESKKVVLEMRFLFILIINTPYFFYLKWKDKPKQKK